MWIVVGGNPRGNKLLIWSYHRRISFHDCQLLWRLTINLVHTTEIWSSKPSSWLLIVSANLQSHWTWKQVFNITILYPIVVHHQERSISGFDTVGYASIRRQNFQVLFLLANFSLSWACDNYKHGNTSNNHLLLDIDCSSFLSFCFDISACWPSKLTSTSTVFWCVRIETESFTFFVADSENRSYCLNKVSWWFCVPTRTKTWWSMKILPTWQNP